VKIKRKEKGGSGGALAKALIYDNSGSTRGQRGLSFAVLRKGREKKREEERGGKKTSMRSRKRKTVSNIANYLMLYLAL